jgi:hypothetical protein
MSNDVDPILKQEAQTKLDNIAVKADLEKLDATLSELFNVKVPELKTITTEDELRTLIDAVKKGTADNKRLTKFIGIANKVLAKI